MVKPKIDVLADWNDDGDFSDAEEDLTANVLAMGLDRRRDLVTEHMNAAYMVVTLDNSDHRYSPPKGTISGLSPGRKLWARMWYPFDSFTGSVPTLNGRTPDEDTGWSWTTHMGSFDGDGAGSARCASTGGTGDSITTLDFGDTDVSIAAHFTRGSDTTDHAGVCIRFVDTSNYAYICITGTAIQTRKVIGGVDSPVNSTAHTWATNTTKLLHVTLHGSSLRVLVNNTAVVDTTLSDAAIDGGTKHGLFADDECDHKWQDFGGFRGLFYGPISKIQPLASKSSPVCQVTAVDDFETWKTTEAHYRHAEDTAFPGEIYNTIGRIVQSVLGGLGGRFRLDGGTALMLTRSVSGTATENYWLKSVDGPV